MPCSHVYVVGYRLSESVKLLKRALHESGKRKKSPSKIKAGDLAEYTDANLRGGVRHSAITGQEVFQQIPVYLNVRENETFYVSIPIRFVSFGIYLHQNAEFEARGRLISLL